MREIKFRVWSIINEPKMIYLKDGLLSDLQTIQNEWHVMQYTGLKDKNGKEIYDSDIIVKKYDNHELRLEVKWENNGGFKELYCSNEIEVIGNIYENSELLTSSPN